METKPKRITCPPPRIERPAVRAFIAARLDESGVIRTVGRGLELLSDKEAAALADEAEETARLLRRGWRGTMTIH